MAVTCTEKYRMVTLMTYFKVIKISNKISKFYRGTQVEVKNKKGNSPLWLAANGGHLNVVDLLYHAGADIDSQDNRKVCKKSKVC